VTHRTARSSTHPLATLTALLVASAPVHALDDQWYLGIGGGAAILRPDAVESGLDAGDDPVGSGTLFAGRDLDERTSVQLQLHGLGETGFDDGRDVAYTGADASVLYRFFDSRDRAPRGTVLGVSAYGRFGLGVMQRDTDVELEVDSDVNFGAGAGLEFYLTRNVALRAEGLYHDRDAGSVNLSFVTRFGGRGRRSLPPTPAPLATRTPSVSAPVETTAVPASPPAPDPAVLLEPGELPDTIAAAPGLPGSPPDAPLPDPATLPETLSLPPGTVVPPAPGTTALPDADTLPEAPPLSDGTTAAPLEPLSAPPGAGSSRREAPIELPAGTELPLPATADRPASPPEAEASAAPEPTPATAPEPAVTDGDADGDGIADADDICARSAPGFPVRDDGCALLDGVLSGLRFDPGTADLAAGGVEQLDYLAGLLTEYPAARIELLAHTDDSGSVRDQSILTRARLKTIGTYLVQRSGVRANRIVLRSFGGARPLYDNRTDEGRERNNRIEIFESVN